MSLRVQLAPLARTGVDLVDQMLRKLHGSLREVIAQTRREVVIRDVELASGVATRVPHSLGYAYSHVSVGPVRGASTSGRIADTTTDRDHFVTLTATGYGATVTVDLRLT